MRRCEPVLPLPTASGGANGNSGPSSKGSYGSKLIPASSNTWI